MMGASSGERIGRLLPNKHRQLSLDGWRCGFWWSAGGEEVCRAVTPSQAMRANSSGATPSQALLASSPIGRAKGETTARPHVKEFTGCLPGVRVLFRVAFWASCEKSCMIRCLT